MKAQELNLPFVQSAVQWAETRQQRVRRIKRAQWLPFRRLQVRAQLPKRCSEIKPCLNPTPLFWLTSAQLKRHGSLSPRTESPLYLVRRGLATQGNMMSMLDYTITGENTKQVLLKRKRINVQLDLWTIWLFSYAKAGITLATYVRLDVSLEAQDLPKAAQRGSTLS